MPDVLVHNLCVCASFSIDFIIMIIGSVRGQQQQNVHSQLLSIIHFLRHTKENRMGIIFVFPSIQSCGIHAVCSLNVISIQISLWRNLNNSFKAKCVHI